MPPVFAPRFARPRGLSAGLLLALGAGVSCSGYELKLPRETPVALSRVTAQPLAKPTVAAPLRAVPITTRDIPRPVGTATVAPVPSDAAEPGEEEAALPELVANAREVIVYAEPRREAQKLGYLRFGARVLRGAKPASRDGCAQGFYSVAPRGFVCVGNAARRGPEPTLGELARRRADRDAPLPYAYGRSKPVPPPLYTHLPSRAETLALEGSAPRKATGFDDFTPAPTPEWLSAGRALPTPFGFARPAALATPRALPNSAFALLEVLEHEGRRFGLTTDLELVPLDRLTRVEASAFHGVVLDDAMALPLVFVRGRHGFLLAGSPTRGFRPARPLAYREALSLSGHDVTLGGVRYLETRSGDWLRDTDLVRVDAPPRLPRGVSEGRAWLRVSILNQTLLAYAGGRPVYATLVSTGADGMGDPETTHATPRGEFRIHTKHLSASMSGDEVGDEFDLRDVPYVQYFTQGYAFHAAYWHDAFGAPHSHGCVNLSPVDSRWLFHFTEPAVPQGWHGAFSREGTLVSVTP